jgi:hypothetical protein
MSTVHAGRFSAEMQDDFVVFVIGMRFNKLWKVHRWLPVFLAMPPMLRELAMHREKGLLANRMMIGGRTLTLLQYWRSFDELEHFARSPGDPHLAAWRRFNAKVGNSGDVGVYHETYLVDADAHETIYVNMPVMGLAAAGEPVPVARRGEVARKRMGRIVPPTFDAGTGFDLTDAATPTTTT